MALLDNPNPCSDISNPQNNFSVDPNTNKISITSSQNTAIPITENCCNVVYLGNLMGNGPFIWQNGACYYGSIPSEPSSTCSTIFNPTNFTFTTGSSNQIIVQPISDGSQVSLTEPCCNPVFLTPILGPNTYLWNNGVCYVNFIPTPPTIPPDCVETSNPLNSWNIGPENEVILLGATLTQNCCNNTVLSYIDPQANFIWQNGICYLNSAPSIPEPPEGTEETPCCYNPSTPITARITTSDENLNSILNQIQTYDSEVNLFDNWVELRATIPAPSIDNGIAIDTNYAFNFALEITNGVNCCCDYNIFVDDIKITCTSGLTDFIYPNKCPGFTLTKVIDNKKSWVYNPGSPEVGVSVYDQIERNDGSFGTIAGEGDINRTFAPSPDADIPWRYTDYLKQSGVFERHSDLVLNSKELWLTFDMCADCPVSGVTLTCPVGYTLETTNGISYCITTTGYTIVEINETTNCYLLNSSTGSYSACTNYNLEVGNYYSGDVVISAGTLNYLDFVTSFDSVTITALVKQNDNKFLIGGNGFIPTGKNLVRLEADGTLDTTFNFGGNSYPLCKDVIVQSNGKIISGWGTNFDANPILLQRVDSGGTYDATFFYNFASFNNPAVIFKLKLNNDDSFYVGGSFNDFYGLNRPKLVKISSSSTIDTSFDTLNKFVGDYVIDIDTLSDGTVIAVGNFDTYDGIVVDNVIALTTSGTTNTATITSVISGSPSINGNQTVWACHVDANDNIYIGGDINGAPGLPARIRKIIPYVGYDTTFSANAGAGFNGRVTKIKQDNDGNLIITGAFTTYKGISSPGVIKLDTNGNVIESFDVGSGILISTVAPTKFANNIAITPENDIVLVGAFDYFNNCSVKNIIKINNSATTISNCYNVVALGSCENCCPYVAQNFVGPYSDTGCTIPALSLTLLADTIQTPTVTYLSLFDLEQYKKQFQSFWIPFMEQFVPATTIWVAGERWCNDPCPTEVDCGFELTSEDAVVQTIEQKSFTSANGAKSFTSTTPENLKSSASFGSPSGNDANSNNSNENVIITEDVGLVNQNVITKTFAENNIDIQAYRSKFTAYRIQTITI